jgi:TolB-like protein/Tfp pilus assembly protein PilF
MSPEQAAGEEVDARADVWSLGAMLYEMLTGAVPFQGDADQAVIYSILHKDPEPITRLRRETPVALEDVVDRALAKNKAKRFRTAAEMLAALEKVKEESELGIKRRRHAAVKRLKRRKRLLAGSLTAMVVAATAFLIVTFHESGQAIDSLAVLPLRDLSSEEGQDYFAEGITGELITKLMDIKDLEKVSPQSAVMRYREADKTLRDIADELGVKGLVAGTIRREGEQVHITAELTYAPTEKLIWSNTFEGNVEGILALQGEVARAISREVRISLSAAEEEALTETRQVNPEAYEVFLKGEKILRDFLIAEFHEAVRYFRQAIDLDPGFARAYAELAEVYVMLGNMEGPDLYREPARAAALKALELDPELPEAYQALGHISYQLEFNWAAAEQAYARAAKLRPHAPANGEYLMQAGRFDEGIAAFERQVELDPLDPEALFRRSWAYLSARRYDDALASYDLHQRLFPGFNDPLLHLHVYMCYLHKGMLEEAFAFFEEKLESEVTGETYEYMLTTGDAFAGRQAKVQEYIDERIDAAAAASNIAEMYAILGDKDQALHWLERMWEVEPEDVIWLNVCIMFDILNDDPRYIAFRNRIGIPDIQWSTGVPWAP